ncbi:MAG: hypothetical protein R3301_02545 [Saprospiraceae bacterium]|nr:hypothetical protein [Saprospiraceae bacterium]
MADDINMDDILQSLSDEELRGLVRKETRRNKAFAMRLSMHAIERLTVTGLNKYVWLLDQILQPDTSGRVRLSARTASVLVEVVTHLLKLSASLRARTELREAHDLLQGVLTRLHQLLDKQTVPDDRLLASLLKAYEELEALAYLPLAPELRADIYRYGLDLLRTSYHRLYHTRHNMLAVMPCIMEDLDQPHRLLDVVRNKIGARQDTTEWAIWYYRILALNHYRHEQAPHIPPERLHGVATALIHDSEALALLIRDHYTHATLNSDQREQWCRWMLDAMLQQSDVPGTLEWALELFRHTGDPKILSEVVSNLARTTAPETLEAHVRDLEHPLLQAALLAAHGRSDELLDLAHKTHRLDILTAHLPALLRDKPTRTREVIPQVLMHFASHHAGIQCGQQVEAFFAALRAAGAVDQEPALREMLRTAFPGRFPIVPLGVEIS